MLTARAVVGDLGGDLVAFQDVLQRLDLEAEAVGDAQQHEDFVGAVAVAVDLQVARENVGQRFQAQVAARLDGRLCPRLFALLVVVPGLAVLLGLGEGADQHRLDAEPACWGSGRRCA